MPNRALPSVALVAAGLALLAAVLFWPAVGYAFVNWDDNVYVTENKDIQQGLTPQAIAWAFTTFHSGNWHPVTWLSHEADVTLYRLDPGGHHRTSILLHAANAALLFLLFHRMTGAVWRSALVAAVFAVHPLRVESVAWVSERKDVLSSTFGLAAMIGYVLWTEKPGIGRYVAMLALYALSLMAKPMLVTLPLLLLVLDAWPLGRLTPATLGPRLREKIPLFILALESSIVTVVAQRSEGAVATLQLFPFVARVENAVVTAAQYLFDTVWPHDLAVFYPHPGTAILAGTLFASIAVGTGLVVASIRLKGQAPYLAAGVAWYAIMLVPVIGIVQVGGQARADRYTYLTTVGLVLPVVWGVESLSRRWRLPGRAREGLLAAASVAWVAALAVATRAQLPNWASSEALMTHAIAVTTGNFPAEVNLGVVYRERGELDKAIAHQLEATRIAPWFGRGWYALGLSLDKAGRHEEARQAYKRSLEEGPQDAQAHFDLGVSLVEQGHADDAIEEFTAAARLEPGSAKIFYNWGTVLASKQLWDDAIDKFSRAIAIDPDYAEAHYNLGVASLMKGDRATARREVDLARTKGYTPSPRVLELLGQAP